MKTKKFIWIAVILSIITGGAMAYFMHKRFEDIFFAGMLGLMAALTVFYIFMAIARILFLTKKDYFID